MLNPAAAVSGKLNRPFYLRYIFYSPLALLLLSAGIKAASTAVAPATIGEMQRPQVDAGESLREIETERPTIESVQDPEM